MSRFYMDEKMQAAKFKSECLKVMERVKKHEEKLSLLKETFLLRN